MTNAANDSARSNATTWLVWLLRMDGVLLLCAIPFIFIPFSVMVEIHTWLGLGELHETPLMNYLTRSLSMIYALHGAVVLYVSCDVMKNWNLIRLLAMLTVALGAVLAWVDFSAGIPWWWLLSEGPPIVAFGAWILAIQRHIQHLDQRPLS